MREIKGSIAMGIGLVYHFPAGQFIYQIFYLASNPTNLSNFHVLPLPRLVMVYGTYIVHNIV